MIQITLSSNSSLYGVIFLTFLNISALSFLVLLLFLLDIFGSLEIDRCLKKSFNMSNASLGAFRLLKETLVCDYTFLSSDSRIENLVWKHPIMDFVKVIFDGAFCDLSSFWYGYHHPRLEGISYIYCIGGMPHGLGFGGRVPCCSSCSCYNPHNGS